MSSVCDVQMNNKSNLCDNNKFIAGNCHQGSHREVGAQGDNSRPRRVPRTMPQLVQDTRCGQTGNLCMTQAVHGHDLSELIP